MLTVILAIADAFSDERFELLYLFVLVMDWHLLDNTFPSLIKKVKIDECTKCRLKDKIDKASKSKSSL